MCDDWVGGWLATDVKPENLLLQADGQLCLSDFGVAKILPNVERCTSTSGTHGYMVRSAMGRAGEGEYPFAITCSPELFVCFTHPHTLVIIFVILVVKMYS